MFPVGLPIHPGMGLESSRLRLRVQVVAAGVRVTYLFSIAMAVWVAATWSRPHREEILVLTVVAIGGAFAVSRLPAERIVRGPYREAFFLAWSLLDIALICLLAYFDGGVTSPATLALFLTQVFAALSYPLVLMIAVAVSSLAGVAVLGVVGGASPSHLELDPAYMSMFLVCLGLTGLLCVWQTRLTERQRDELAELSRTDPLTGCLNRRGFSERLVAELQQGGVVSLIQLDLNGFKAVNDQHGHAAGDELLRWVGSTLQALLRESDATGPPRRRRVRAAAPWRVRRGGPRGRRADGRGAGRAHRRRGGRCLPPGRRRRRGRAAPARRRGHVRRQGAPAKLTA